MAPEKREFIDPNDLMRYINEDHSYAGLPMAAHVCTMELLTYAPRVDAVEVVRCRDCKHYKKLSCAAQARMCFTPRGLCSVSDDDYCSRGERRDNG